MANLMITLKATPKFFKWKNLDEKNTTNYRIIEKTKIPISNIQISDVKCNFDKSNVNVKCNVDVKSNVDVEGNNNTVINIKRQYN